MTEAHKKQVKKALKNKLTENQPAIIQCILTGERQKDLLDPSQLRMTLDSPGMPEFNKSQRNAIIDACKQSVTLVQGPPGTGKTRVLAAIVANMILQNPTEQILVATSMNFTADLVAEELYKLKMMQAFVVRTYSRAREDVFNIRLRELPEFSILHKMIFKTEFLDEYTMARTVVNQNQAEEMGVNRLL